MAQKIQAPLEIEKEQFKSIGYALVDRIAEHFDTIRDIPVTPGETPGQVRRVLGDRDLPEAGMEAGEVMKHAADLVLSHSLFPGHPRFWGYIIGAGTQIGALSEMLAATVNANVGGWNLSPMATEIELQCIKWIAQFIGYPETAGGILVSGGAMANYVGFLAARKASTDFDLRVSGVSLPQGRLRMYCSHETHTWIQKASDLFGHGTDAVHWIATDDALRMQPDALEAAIKEDISAGDIPSLVIANAGTVSTGVVDDLKAIRDICRKHDIWFHVDGAYGGPAAGLPEHSEMFAGIADADSIALDPHKWFYAPLEAGCLLVREPKLLTDAFSYRPPYYHFEEYTDAPGINFHEYGPQNSRGFRALKVWTGFLQAGRSGMQELIRRDIAMASLLFDIVREAKDFEAFQRHLSMATFRYVPAEKSDASSEDLNAFNEAIMVRLQASGKAFITNAVVHGKFILRACFVNFRTREEDVRALPDVIRSIGRELLQ